MVGFYIENKSFINIHMFNFKSKHNVSSVLFFDDKDCILFNSQFEKEFANKISDFIKNKNLNLKFIFITHYDPEYYFGTCEYIKTHKNTVVYATPQILKIIKNTYNCKLIEYKNYVPEKIIEPVSYKYNFLYFKNIRFEIKKSQDYEFIFCRELDLILANNIIWHNIHPRLNNINKDYGLQSMIKHVKLIKNYNIKYIIPGHLILDKFIDINSACCFTEYYLEVFQNAVNTFKQSKDIINYVQEFFKDLPKENNLKLSSDYFTREIQNYDIINSVYFFPPLGKDINLDLYEINSTSPEKYKFLMRFFDGKKLGFRNISENSIDYSCFIFSEYNYIAIDYKIFMLYWNVENNNITQIQNWKTKHAYTVINYTDKNTTKYFQGKILI